MNAMILFSTLALTVPPATKVVAIAVALYAVIQGLKKVPFLTKYLVGWVAIAVNILLAVGSLFIPPNGIDAAQLYTASTAQAVFNVILTVLTTSGFAAGIHGTVSAMSPPQMLVTTPPATQVHEAPATLEPENLKDKPAN